ncbi:exosome complex component CSL4 isoform X2 [Mus musculus]|uniref:exosome complex component CSL4 isoform X2 n=1 Tax=Mus musculus TaxID=10090 RepID=UPI0005AB9D3F|nr:exosome complex component CSL4 isoform X2 [Mus musculus]|eukprot:XP_011245615.1 PREDICTED: exosome complex component CSL4 isoform X2 [Mus musculus]
MVASMAPPVRYCIPGERLCNLEEGSPGSGTYTRHGYIFSSLAGCLMKTSENGAVKEAATQRAFPLRVPVVSVMRETESQLLPDVGAVVTCKVSSINSRFAKVHILYVGSTPLKNAFRGTIRKEDIRATEKDKISLGDAQSNYLLTTAENELGVVVAHSESGVQMVPISWCEMQCPKTHTKEFRKVARVQPEFLQT